MELLFYTYVIITGITAQAVMFTDNFPVSRSYKEECQRIYGYNSDSSHLVVSECPEEYEDSLTASRCSDPASDPVGKIPVSDVWEKLTFKNIFCAICHGRYAEITRWQLSMRCDEGVVIKHVDDLKTLSGCRDTVDKPDRVTLTPCDELTRARRATKTLTANDPVGPSTLGYSTLLNFGVDGKMHIMLTTDGDELLKAQCTDGQIFNPFDKQCISVDCPASHISYNGECLQPVSYIKEQKQLCVDHRIAYSVNGTAGQELTNPALKRAVSNFLLRDYVIEPEAVIYSLLDPGRASLCSEGSVYGSYLVINMTDGAGNTTGQALSLNLIENDDFGDMLTCNVSDSVGDIVTGEARIALKFSYSEANRAAVEQLVDSGAYDRWQLVLRDDSRATDIGKVCVASMNVTVENLEWCNGWKNEYTNDEFTLLEVDSRPIGVRVAATNKTYHLSQFQYTMVIGGSFWGNISQIASTCDALPRLEDQSCPKLALQPPSYRLLSNGSVHVVAFDKFSLMELPFDSESRGAIPSVFNETQYEFISNSTEEILERFKSNDVDELRVTVCIPVELLALFIEIDVWNKVHINRSCDYLEQFGYGSTIAGLVFSGISMIAMVLVLVTYSLFRTMRTLPGVSLMHLTVAVMLSQITLIAGLFVPGDMTDKDYGCFAVAVVTHYCTLASLMWMNVMAYSSYRAFGANLKTRLRQLSRRHVVMNCLYGWGLPAVIVVTSAVIDHVFKDQRLIGYGSVSDIQVFGERNGTGTLENIQIRYRARSSCWISNSRAALVIFGLPLLYCMAVNLGMFIKTCRGVRKDGRRRPVLRRDSGSGHLKDHNDMSIHLRLTAQYGFAWIFAIVIIVVGTLKTESKTICYVLYILNLFFNILHGCTGLFIFIAFVCNRRVLHLYKSKISRHQMNRNRSSTSIFQVSSSTRAIPSLSASAADGIQNIPPTSP